MRQHSIIIEDFFDDPLTVRNSILHSPMTDHKATDGVTYPGIVKLPEEVEVEFHGKLDYLFQGRVVEEPLLFARHSMDTMTPPHWAHSDFNMAGFTALVYLSPIDKPEDGTFLVKHKKTGMETHPQTEEQVEILLKNANNRDEWDITFHCPSKFNRLFLINSHLLHAAGPSFGTTRDDSRLVCTAFLRVSDSELE